MKSAIMYAVMLLIVLVSAPQISNFIHAQQSAQKELNITSVTYPPDYRNRVTHVTGEFRGYTFITDKWFAVVDMGGERYEVPFVPAQTNKIPLKFKFYQPIKISTVETPVYITRGGITPEFTIAWVIEDIMINMDQKGGG